MVSEGAKGGGDQSSTTEYRGETKEQKLTTNEGVSLEYYRATGGDQVNFTVTQ